MRSCDLRTIETHVKRSLRRCRSHVPNAIWISTCASDQPITDNAMLFNSQDIQKGKYFFFIFFFNDYGCRQHGKDIGLMGLNKGYMYEHDRLFGLSN